MLTDFEASKGPTTDAGAPGWPFAVAAGILGWILDAFDFFVVVFLFDTLAANFHVGKAQIVYSLTLTLASRPIGALVFGALADRYGRKLPLIACVVYFSSVTVLSGFAPNYVDFLILRGLYGVGMGGYWGIGASYAMESAPRRRRGLLSGLMQSGYPFGYLMAAVAMIVIAPTFGWRALFVVGSGVAALIVILTLVAPESPAWHVHRPQSMGKIARAMASHFGIFFYLLVAMMAMTCFSHGTQDLYPDFLKSIPGLHGKTVLGLQMLFGIPIVYNIGAILGALFFGQISERMGRRRSLILAVLLGLVSIPAWAFGTTMTVLLLGSFFMQAGVQGAFGIVPAHLIELSPASVRSLFPGFVYQLGVLLSSPAVSIEYLLRDHLGYPWALTAFELCVIGSLLLLFGFGPERHGRDLHHRDGT